VLLVRSREGGRGEEKRERKEKREGRGEKTFGGVGSFVFTEPLEVFVFHPGHVGVVVGIVFFTGPLHCWCDLVCLIVVVIGLEGIVGQVCCVRVWSECLYRVCRIEDAAL